MTLLHEDLTHTASRLRVPTAKNIEEDVGLVSQGVLDPQSFLSGYQFHNHPVELLHHNAEGKLLHIRRSHNLRTNKGGHDEGVNMSGSAVGTAQYIALSNTAFTPSSTDTVLSGEITGGGLSRVLATFSFVIDPSVVGTTQPSTVQGSYKLVATWSVTTATNNIQACGVFNAASGGDLWFESTFGLINTNVGDSLQLTYTINY